MPVGSDAAFRKAVGRSQAARLVDARHLLQRQPLRERDGPQEDVAARQLARDVLRRDRSGEAILPRLQLSLGACQEDREPERPLVADDAGLDERAADRVRPGARRDLDELVDARIALELLVHAGVVDPGHGGDNRRQQHDDENQSAHWSVGIGSGRAVSRNSCRMTAAAAASRRALRFLQSRSRSASRWLGLVAGEPLVLDNDGPRRWPRAAPRRTAPLSASARWATRRAGAARRRRACRPGRRRVPVSPRHRAPRRLPACRRTRAVA